MVCNEVQWSATSCNNRAKRIVLSTKKGIGCRWRKSFTTFFTKKSPILKPYHKRPSTLNWKRLTNSLT